MAKTQKALKGKIDTIACGDCGELMAQLPDDSIDLILTSPPYSDQRSYGDRTACRISPDKYVAWFEPKAREILRIMKPTGNFVLNINDRVVGHGQHLFVFELVLKLVKEIGFTFVRDYIWHNPATPPNRFSWGQLGRTKKSHEYCFWFSKSDKWVFNMDAIRRPYGKDMQKYLEGKGRGSRSENQRPSTHNFDCGKVWTDHGGADPGSVITLANTDSRDSFFKMCKDLDIKHPARFPVKLADFFILAGTNPGQTVLDPFMGSGTTAVSAKKNGRHWIGFDCNEQYCELARQRVEATEVEYKE